MVKQLESLEDVKGWVQDRIDKGETYTPKASPQDYSYVVQTDFGNLTYYQYE